MYIGNKQIVNASSDKDGKSGETKDDEIRVQSFYSGPWTKVLRYTA